MDDPKNSKSELIRGHEKEKSEIYKKLIVIKDSFDVEWLSEKQKDQSSSKHGSLSKNGDSSSSATLNRNNSKVRPKANHVETESKLPNQPIRGFVNEILFLKNFLLKKQDYKEFKTLAIVGKYGVGKTTLCQAVFNDIEVKHAYLPRLWISMYREEETQEDKDPKISVLKRILRSLGVEDEMLSHIKTEAEEEKRIKDEAGELQEKESSVQKNELSRLLNTLQINLIGKKYLIVLDDVWEDNEWNHQELSSGFPKEFGGRVILTSRDEKVAKEIVEEENVLRLFPRTDQETVWEIYKDAMSTPMEPRYPGRFKRDLMDKSCGIPMAVRMLAKIEPVKVDETGEDGVVKSDKVYERKPTKDSDVSESSREEQNKE